MEILLFWLIVGYAFSKGTILELPFTIHGKNPPSHEYRMEKLRQRRSSGGRSMPSSRTGRYFSGLADHALAHAEEKRTGRHAVKSAKLAVRTEHKVRTAEDRTKAKLEKRTAKKSRQWGQDSGQDNLQDTPKQSLSSDADSLPEKTTGLAAFPQDTQDTQDNSQDRTTPTVAPKSIRPAEPEHLGWALRLKWAEGVQDANFDPIHPSTLVVWNGGDLDTKKAALDGYVASGKLQSYDAVDLVANVDRDHPQVALIEEAHEWQKQAMEQAVGWGIEIQQNDGTTTKYSTADQEEYARWKRQAQTDQEEGKILGFGVSRAFRAPEGVKPDSMMSVDESNVRHLPTQSHQPQAVVAETQGLMGAIDHCALIENSLRGASAIIEQMAATLESDGKLDGPVLDHMNGLWAYMDQASSGASAAAAALRSLLPSKDSLGNVQGDPGSMGYLLGQPKAG